MSHSTSLIERTNIVDKIHILVNIGAHNNNKNFVFMHWWGVRIPK